MQNSSFYYRAIVAKPATRTCRGSSGILKLRKFYPGGFWESLWFL
jgi:hypothetical protein